MTSLPARRPAALLALALFVATGVGVPVHHHADHHGEEAHVTSHGHGHGHGATLVVRDMRTERPATAVELPAAPVERIRTAPAVADRRPRPRALPAPTGRSPPSTVRPRAPPLSS